MLYKFGVIRTLTGDTRLFVCGSAQELGDWDAKEAVELETTRYVLNEPSFWTGEVEIADEQCPFEFKFLCKYDDDRRVEWEGNGPEDNRSSAVESEKSNELDSDRHMLNPSWWVEPGDPRNEFHHTLAFYYDRVVHDGGIHFSKIRDKLWMGSCPRQPYHVSMLKSLGVDTIMTFQTETDIVNNSSGAFTTHDGGPNVGEAVIDRLEETYRRSGMSLIWFPTTDMCTQARRRMLPQAVVLLKALLDNGRSVYIHCNAGVGRAGAVAAGYLMYVEGMSMKEMMYFLYDKRPAVFVDKEALTEAKKDFAVTYCPRAVELTAD